MRSNVTEYDLIAPATLDAARPCVGVEFCAELIDPGVVIFSYWRPDISQPDFNADQVWGYGGVARV